MDMGDETVRELREKYTQETTAEPESSSLKESRVQVSDAESIENESIVANTEEIALKALHVDDDPTLNPWTFRVFFLGLSRLCARQINNGPNHPRRSGPLCLWIRARHDLSVQASVRVGLDHLSDSHLVWRRHGYGDVHTEKRNSEMAQPASLQLQGASRHRHHVEFCVSCGPGDGSPRGTEAILQRHSQQRRGRPAPVFQSAFGVWACWSPSQESGLPYKDAVAQRSPAELADRDAPSRA